MTRYIKLNQKSKAVPYLREYLEVEEKKLELSKDVQNSETYANALHSVGIGYNNLGVTSNNTSDYERAIAYYKKALDIYEKLTPSQPLKVIECLDSMALTYGNLNQNIKKFNCLERALVIRKSLFGPEDPRLIKFINDLAAVAHIIAKEEIAKEEKERNQDLANQYFRKALSGYKEARNMMKKYSVDPLEVSVCLNNISCVYNDTDLPKEALPYCMEALAIREKSGVGTLIAESYNNLGIVYIKLKQIDKTTECCSKSLRIIEANLSLEYLDILENLSTIYSDLKRYKEELYCYEKCLSIMDYNDGVSCNNLSIRISNKGVNYNNTRSYNQALQCYMVALKIRETLYKGQPNENIIDMFRKIAMTYGNLGNVSKKRDYETRASDMEKQLKKLSGSGLMFSYQKDKLTYSYTFNEYFNEGLDNILTLRIGRNNNIKLLRAQYYYNESDNNITSMIKEIIAVFSQQNFIKILVPFNLYKKHWTGFIFEKSGEYALEIKYFDPENTKVPFELQNYIVTSLLCQFGYVVNFTQMEVEQQLFDNCGSEVVENFMLHITGERAAQEDAVPLHFSLIEAQLTRSQPLHQTKLYSNVGLLYKYLP